MNKKLFVGGLSWDTTDESMKAAFAQAGAVADADEDGSAAVKVIKDASGRSKGFGFVCMATDEDATKAVEMWNGKELDGRTVTVNEARPKTDRPER